MLQYVTTKLESQSLDASIRIRNSQNPVQGELRDQDQIEDSTDSGTETDDETGGPDEDFMEMDFSEDSLNMPSAAEPGPNPAMAFGPGFLTQSGSTPVNALSALQLACDDEWSARKENIDYFGKIPFSECSTGFHHHYVDNDGNHSSEEELEEINNKIDFEPEFCKSKQGIEEPAPSAASIEIESSKKTQKQNGDSNLNLTVPKSAFNGSSSGDEELTASANATTIATAELDRDPPPVEFSTCPPVDVYRPRRSSSPPSKVFSNTTIQGSMQVQSDASEGNFCKSWTSPLPPSSMQSQELELHSGRCHRERRTISPKKRYKQSRIHHIQRPCLDFEKMQQLKTRAVTSWRHGGELSLFCW